MFRTTPQLTFLTLLALLSIVSATPKAIDVIQSAGHLEEHQPNFCNRTDLALESGLQKTALGQFLGYSCSADFYHCRWQSDGYRTYKKSCRVGGFLRKNVLVERLLIKVYLKFEHVNYEVFSTIFKLSIYAFF